jgi:sialate O-acetylesterase
MQHDTMPRVQRVAVLLCLLLPLLTPSANADVTVPALFSNGMVFQRNAPIRVWGQADPGEAVTVELNGKKVTAERQNGGKWLAVLPAMQAGGPHTLTVQGKNRIEVKDVLIGEVWLCSGQSNMEWTLRNSFEPQPVIASAANPNIRLFQVKNTRSENPLDNVEATWQACTPETVANFSAVAYYFGRDLQKTLGVPIGLIQSDWGGSPAEAWTRPDLITDNPELREIATNYTTARERYEKALATYDTDVEKAKAEGKEPPQRPRIPWRYGELYNGMIAPLVPFVFRGVIWYQGESNVGRAGQYSTLFPTMIQNWRNDFQNGDFPFLLVQLAPYSPGGSSTGTGYAELRESQYVATKTLKNVGMAVITDVGEERDIHPRRKQPVGERLALLARKMVYREKVVAESPTFDKMSVKAGKVYLKFRNVGSGLEARGGTISEVTVEPGKLVGFTIGTQDGTVVPAMAEIVGKDTVVVWSPEVPNPTRVHYGFINFPVVNLFSKEGLPVSPFRTDMPPLPKPNLPKMK